MKYDEATLAALDAVEPVDYADDTNWFIIEKDGTKDVDVVYLYPTTVTTSVTGNYATIDEVREELSAVCQYRLDVYAEHANIYMPLYRQLSFDFTAEITNDADVYVDFLGAHRPYHDIENALDYYFAHYNLGKPYILAGHSQGSALVCNVLRYYMKKHPDVYERMVAAYVIGYGPSPAYYDANPHVKFAEGETDTGVVISWNTEGPGAQEKCLVLADHALVINPLNWRRDETYAPASMNKGTYVDGEILMDMSDAQLDLARGVVVSTTTIPYITGCDLFSEKSLHNNDYALFFYNLKENVGKRIAAYWATHA